MVAKSECSLINWDWFTAGGIYGIGGCVSVPWTDGSDCEWKLLGKDLYLFDQRWPEGSKPHYELLREPANKEYSFLSVRALSTFYFSWHMSDCFPWPFYLQQLFTLTFCTRHVSSQEAQKRNFCFQLKRNRRKQGLSQFQTCQPAGNEGNALSQCTWSRENTHTHMHTYAHTHTHTPLLFQTE